MGKNLKIVIDPRAGFCGGVKRAIKLVEKSLVGDTEIFVRGELIHNQREMERLQKSGLNISPEVNSNSAKTMFIRTHGETPEIYCKAEQLNISVIDATCGNVRRSQKIIAKAAAEGRRIYIFGKKHHPEIIGLLGYCKGLGIVLESDKDIDSEIVNIPSLLIPQTTAHPNKFEKIRRELALRIDDLQVYNAICPFVSKREEELKEFAVSVEAIVFVGGKQSSNTAVLFGVCKKVNPNSFWVDRPEELNIDELKSFNNIGISGSASTPMWQLKEIANYISDKLK